jgi:hypothetical protein
MNRFEMIVVKAKKVAPSWTNREVVFFHYFNKNGLLEQKRITDAKISKAVDENLCKSGAIIAYGSMNDYYENRLDELCRKARNKKNIAETDLSVVLACLREEIKKAEEFLQTL